MVLRGAILAAGLGTRLRPLTHALPKPLVPVADRPLIEYSLDCLARLGIKEIGVNAHHKAERLGEGLQHRSEKITIVHEEKLLGTGGGIRGIAEAVGDGTLVVLNGDALFDFDLRPVLKVHHERQSLGTLALRYVPPHARFGRVGIDGAGQLKKIAELSAPGADSQTLFYGAYTGVQIIETELIRRIPDGECDILRTAYNDVLVENGQIYGHFVPPTSTWVDVGTLDRYLEAHITILSGDLTLSHLPCVDTQGRRISESAHLHPTCQISGPSVIMPGARLEENVVIGPNTFIGRDSIIRPNSIVRNSVVWPCVSAGGDMMNDVVFESR